MAVVTSTTRLQAVNKILAAVNEAPVASLPATRRDAVLAEAVLDEVTREVLSRGWHFNTETITVTPNVSNEIPVQATWAKVDLNDPSYYRGDYDIVVRDAKLYNTVTNSSTFTTSMKVEVVLFQDFEKIPEAARRYIMVRAARIFQDTAAGAPNIHQFQERDEMMALLDLRDQEATDADYTVFDSWAVQRVVNRLSPLSGIGPY
jgi:hypothetical protein